MNEMRDKTIKDFMCYEENPAVSVMIFPGRKEQVMDKRTNNYTDGTTQTEISSKTLMFKMDKLPCSKIFDGWWLSGGMDISHPTYKLLGWLLMNLHRDQDEIKISPVMVMKELDYKSPVPVYKGIIELLEMGALYRKLGKAPVYFINVNFFFRGDRCRLPRTMGEPVNNIKPKQRK